MIKTITDFGDLAVLLPLVAVVTVWLVALRQPRALLWWFVALALCMGSTAALKIYFFVCTPLTDMHSPSGHTSLSTLVYGAFTLAVAMAVNGWKRFAVIGAGAMFIAAIGISRIVIHAHSIPEVMVGSLIGGGAGTVRQPVLAPPPDRASPAADARGLDRSHGDAERPGSSG